MFKFFSKFIKSKKNKDKNEDIIYFSKGVYLKPTGNHSTNPFPCPHPFDTKIKDDKNQIL